MIDHPAFDVEPSGLRECSLELDALAHTESVFALANGHVGLRGTLAEGEPSAVSGTYLNGFYEERPLPYAEAGYGYPEPGQTVVNVPIPAPPDVDPVRQPPGLAPSRRAQRPARAARAPTAPGAARSTSR